MSRQKETQARGHMDFQDSIKKKKNWRPVQAKVDKDIVEKAFAKAKAEGVTITAVVEAALKVYIADFQVQPARKKASKK